MMFLDSLKTIFQVIKDNYSDLSDLADLYALKLEEYLNFQIKEVILNETELRQYLLKEINRIKEPLSALKNVEFLQIEEKSRFNAMYALTQEEIEEDAKKETEQKAFRVLSVFHGVSIKEWEQLKLTVNIEDHLPRALDDIVKLWGFKRYYRVLKSKLSELDEIVKKRSEFGPQSSNLLLTEEVQPVLGQLGKGKEHQATTSQLVIMASLMNEVYKIKKHQDKKPLIQFIEFLSGKNAKNISTNIAKYDAGNGLIHKSKKQNLEDYYAVREIFQGLENQSIIKIIDERLKQINKLSDK